MVGGTDRQTVGWMDEKSSSSLKPPKPAEISFNKNPTPLNLSVHYKK